MKDTSVASSATQPFSVIESGYQYHKTRIEHITESPPGGKTNHPAILLIATDKTLVKLINDCLPNFEVQCISTIDGYLQQKLVQTPSLVLIDAGTAIQVSFNCCDKIKEDKKTSNHPVILIIKKSFLNACIKETTANVDDYIVRPFSKDELLLRVKKLLNTQPYLNTGKPKPDLKAIATATKTGVTDIRALDDPFLKAVLSVIDQQLGATDFGVEDIAGSVFMSRAQLHRKLIRLIGLAPGTLIKNCRLERAAQLLAKGHNSSQTAYKTGFNSPAYFTSCFHKFYKLTPSEYCRNNTKATSQTR